MTDIPFIDSVLHPSDFSEASHAAFNHAMAVTLFRQGRLTVMHVVSGDRAIDDWTNAPQVRETLEAWGLLEEGSSRGDVFDRLAIKVSKINVRAGSPLKAITKQMDKRPADLVVLATEGREGMPRWLSPSIAESVARRTNAMTLFVPGGSGGFVDPENGRIGIRRILIPVDHQPEPAAALTYAARAAVMSNEESVELVLLRIGDETSWPELELPELRTCTWRRMVRQGNVVKEIVTVAEEVSADLVVMATEGRTGILDALRGSVTEQVLRGVGCPLLAVPAGRD